MNSKTFPSFIVFFFTLTQILSSQKEVERNLHNASPDVSQIRSLFVESNNIRTILYNTGSLSGPGVAGNVYDLVWKGMGYAYEIGFLAGAKVPSALNANDSILFIIDGFGSANRSTADGDFSPDAVTKWGWMPTSRYSNASSKSIANNQDPSTWPADWNSWNGKYGAPIADMELMYEINDSTDAEFPYYPFPSDSLRRGLGLSVTARYYQFSHANLENVFFTFFEIQNVSNKPLTKMVAGIIGDPHIGGMNNYADDTQDYDTTHNLFYSWDPDNKGDNPMISPGYFGFSIIQSPQQKGVTSYASLVYGGNNRPKNDAMMYNTLSEGSKLSQNFYSTDSNNLGDFLMIQGTGFYSLAPQQKEEFGAAYLFADDLEHLIQQAETIDREYKIRFNVQGNTITLTAPAPAQSVQGNSVLIQWSDTAMDNDTTISLYFSNTPDGQWQLIDDHLPNTGSFQWDVTSLADGIFYKIHILKEKNGMVSYDSTGGYFTVNKPGDASPQIVLLQPMNMKTASQTLSVLWLAGDADGDPLAIKISFSNNDGYTYSPLWNGSNTGVFLFDTKQFPNTALGKIKIEAAANGTSVFAESKTFRINNFFFAITDTGSLQHLAGTATGKIFPGVADSAAITGHHYRITFDSIDHVLKYSLKNTTLGTMRLTNEYLTGNNGSGTLVDGMRIWFENHPVRVDTGRSNFIIPRTNVLRSVQYRYSTLPFKYVPFDYKIVFSSMDTNASGMYSVPADSFPPSSGTTYVKTPFTVMNLSDTSKPRIRIFEKNSTTLPRKQGRWDFGEEIVFLTPQYLSTASNQVHANVIFTIANVNLPSGIAPGDVFMLYAQRPFTPNDVFEFTADVKYGKPTSVPGSTAVPKVFALEQNYPNPFNPETSIRFNLAQKGRTSLKIYDAIGREVRTLFDEEMQDGSYTVSWNGEDNFGRQAASGLYFYRLHSGNSSSTKKMILLR